jgi:hypothetical protein
VIETSRIQYLLPICPPAALAVRYEVPDDLSFIQRWLAYLRHRDQVPESLRTTVIGGDDPCRTARLVMNVHDGHADRGEILHLGQHLVLQAGRLRVLDTEVLTARFRHISAISATVSAGGGNG